MRRIITKSAVFLLTCLAVYTLLGVLIAPLVLESILPGKLSQIIHQAVSIEKIRINPYALSFSIENLAIQAKEGEEPFLSLGTFHINFQVKSLLQRAVICKELLVEEPFIHIKKDQQGDINIRSLIAALGKDGNAESANQSKAKKETAIPVVRLDSITVSAGKIIFSDDSLRSVRDPVTMGIQNLKVTGKNISTDPDSHGDLVLTFEDELGGTVSVNGPVGFLPLSADLQFTVDGYHIIPFRDHIVEYVRMIIEDGTIATRGTITINESPEGQVMAAYKGTATVSDFSSVDQATKDRFIEFTTLCFRNIDAGYNPGFLKIDKIDLFGFYAGLIMNPDKTVNALSMLKKTETQADTTEEKSRKLFDPMIIREISLENGHVSFSDRSITPVYSTDLISIEGTISGLSSAEARRTTLAFRGKLDKTVPVEISGEMDPFSEDLSADVRITLDNKDLSPLTPYSGKYLGRVIDKGKITLNLKYQIDGKKLVSRNKIFIDQLTLGKKVDSPDAVTLPVELGIALLKNRKGEIDLDVPVTGKIDDPEFSVGYFILKILGNIIEKAVTAPFALIGSVFGGGEELGYVEFDFGSSIITEKNAKKIDVLVAALYDRPLLKLDIEGHVDVSNDMESLRRAVLEKKVQSARYDDYIAKGLPSPSAEKIDLQPEEYRRYLIMTYMTEEAVRQVKVTAGEIEKRNTEEIEQLVLNSIVVTEGDLRRLAYERASRVREYILQSGKVEAERIFLVEPHSLQIEATENIKSSEVRFYLK